MTITSTSLENKIEIEVTPESNDIVAKENLYIVLDTTGNSKLNLLEDVLVSGSNVLEQITYHYLVLLATKNIQDNRCQIKKLKYQIFLVVKYQISYKQIIHLFKNF